MAPARLYFWSKICAFVVLTMIAGVIAILYGLLQTKPGHDYLAKRLIAALSDEQTVVRIVQLEGSLASSFKIKKLTIADPDGIYVTAESIQLSWNPMAALGRKLDIETLSVERVRVDRLPHATIAADTSLSSNLLQSFDLNLGVINLPEITLAPPVLGSRQRFAATASTRLDRDAAAAALDLTVRDLDSGENRAHVKIDYAAAPARFAAQIQIDEPSGGLIARLAGLPGGDPISISLSGDGPPENWRGKLKAYVGSTSNLDADVSVVLQPGKVSLSFDGAAAIGGLIPEQLQPVITPNVRFGAAADLIPFDRITLRRMTVEGDTFNLLGNGFFNATDDVVSAEFSLKFPSKGQATKIYPSISISQGQADVSLAGTLSALYADVAFSIGNFSFGDFRTDSVEGSIAIKPSASDTFDVTGNIRANKLDNTVAGLQQFIGPALDVSVSGKLQRGLSNSTITAIAVAGANTVEVASTIENRSKVTGLYAIRIGDIEPAMRAVGLAFKGTVQAEGTFRTDLDARSMHIVSSGEFTELHSKDTALTVMLGEHIPFSGAVEWRDGTTLDILGVRAITAAGRVQADGAIDVQTKHLSGNIDIAVPTLKQLSTIAGTPLAGTAAANAVLTGSFDKIVVRGQMQVEDLKIDKVRLGNFGIGYTVVQENDALNAAIRLGGTLREKPLSGSMNARLRQNKFDFSGIELSLNQNRLAGMLNLDVKSRRLFGEIRAELAQLEDLPGAELYGISGAMDILLRSGGKKTDEINVTADATNVQFQSAVDNKVTIAKARAYLNLRTPYEVPAFEGEIHAERISRKEIQKGETTVKFSGDLSKIDWSISARAAAPYPVSLASNGTIDRAGESFHLTMRKFAGDVSGQAAELRAPFLMIIRRNEWQIQPLEIAFADGHVQFQGAVIDGLIDAKGKLENLQLPKTSLIEPRFRFNGKLDGVVHVTGMAQKPFVAGSFSVREFRPTGVPKSEFAGFNAALTVDQNADAIEAALNITGPEDTRLKAKFKTHPLLRFHPFAFGLGRNLPLSGELEADGKLKLIDSLIGLGEDRINGNVAAKVLMTGTLGEPAIRGNLRLKDGFYEGVATGTVLRDIDAHLTFTGDSARLVSLTAKDSSTGSLSGAGEIKFTDTANLGGHVAVNIDGFSVLRHQLGDIVATGALTLAGSIRAPRVQGQLSVDKGNIRIPDDLPEGFVRLDVIEVNGSTVGITEKPKRAEPSASDALAVPLDISILFPGQTFVRGRGLNSEWKGKLKIDGTSAAPRLAGALDVVRGTFAFAGKTFVINSGNVTFPGTAVSEPELGIVAESKLREIVARIEINGPLSKPTIGISSVPVLPQEDVLAHILFGRTTGRLSAIQAAQLAQTAATLSGNGGTAIVDKIRQVLGVDVLDIESADGDTVGASLKAGKYLTEDIFLSVTQGTQAGSQKVSVEVQVLPNVTVESKVSGDGDSNIGVNWKWDY